MKAVRVQYTVKSEFVEQNIKNIRSVMASIQANPIKGMFYSTYKLQDGVTFMHVNIAVDEETMSKLNSVEAFSTFRTALKESGPVHPPKSENIELIGSSSELFS